MSIHLGFLSFFNIFDSPELANNYFSILFILVYLVSSSTYWPRYLFPLCFIEDYFLNSLTVSFFMIMILIVQIMAFSLCLFLQERGRYANKIVTEEEFYTKLNSKDLISLKNIFFKYPGSQSQILRNLNLTLKRGETTCLVGKNGSGKSTLVRLLLGLENINQGLISRKSRNLKASLIAQNNFGFDNLTVLEIIEFFKKILNLKEQDFQRQLVKKLGMGIYLSTRLKDLSKGNQRKVSILIGLLQQPDILILDEPTNNLGTLYTHVINNYNSI